MTWKLETDTVKCHYEVYLIGGIGSHDSSRFVFHGRLTGLRAIILTRSLAKRLTPGSGCQPSRMGQGRVIANETNVLDYFGNSYL